MNVWTWETYFRVDGIVLSRHPAAASSGESGRTARKLRCGGEADRCSGRDRPQDLEQAGRNKLPRENVIDGGGRRGGAAQIAVVAAVQPDIGACRRLIVAPTSVAATLWQMTVNGSLAAAAGKRGEARATRRAARSQGSPRNLRLAAVHASQKPPQIRQCNYAYL